jgi:hypothetical protein
MKEHIEKMKVDVRLKFPNLQVFHYLPTFPRKHLTISMIGPWNSILEAKELLQSISHEYIT